MINLPTTNLFVAILVLLTVPRSSNAFQPAGVRRLQVVHGENLFFLAGDHHHHATRQQCFCRRPVMLQSSSSLSSSPEFAEEPDDDESSEDDVGGRRGLTPKQIKLLRKEVAKRRARKSLAQIWLPETSTSSSSSDFVFAPEWLNEVLQRLDKEELVEIRGISKNDPKNVFATSQELAVELTLIQQQEGEGSDEGDVDVEWVETKGFASTFYAPSKSNPKIVLRSSYKEGVWSKKAKMPRDYRGQIIWD